MLRNYHAGRVPGRRFAHTAILIFVAFIAFSLVPDSALAGPPSWASGRILVAPQDGSSPAAFDKALRGQGGKSLGKLRGLGVHVVNVPPKAEAAVVRALMKNPHVKFAELDVAVALSDVTPNDTYYDCPDRERAQWWGDAVNEIGEAFYALDPRSNDLAKKGILELMNWQREDGTIFSPVPAGNWNKELPMQMLNSVGYYGIWNYYQYTGYI